MCVLSSKSPPTSNLEPTPHCLMTWNLIINLKADTNLWVCTHFKCGTNFEARTKFKAGTSFKALAILKVCNFKAGTNYEAGTNFYAGTNLKVCTTISWTSRFWKSWSSSPFEKPLVHCWPHLWHSTTAVSLILKSVQFSSISFVGHNCESVVECINSVFTLI